jgi:hypothetical protein
MAVKKESDQDSGGDIKNPGVDNPGYSKGDSKDKDAFKDINNIWNNQTIDQEAPKVDKDEAKYGDAPFVKSDDAKALSDIRDKFAPNADKPTTASNTKGKKLPEILQEVDPQSLAQMLPNMMKGMSKARDVMNISIPAARVSVITDSFGGALAILAEKLGYEQVINSMGTALGGNAIDTKIDPPYRSIVFNGIINLIKQAILYGAGNIPQPIYNKVTYGTYAPQPLVADTQVPLLYVKQYYAVKDDPYPGYIQWLSPDGTKSVYVKRGPTDYPTDSALEELYNNAEINLSNKMLLYVAANTLTAELVNQFLREQDQQTYDQGVNNSLGNGAGGGGGGGGGQGMQQLLGKLQPILEKFKNGQLMNGVLNKSKNQQALQKFEKNMGSLNKMEQDASSAFGMGNLGEIGNLQSQLGQLKGMLGKGGGGGGGGSGGGQPSGGGGGGSSYQPPLTKQELSSTSNLLNTLANTNPTSLS